MAARLQFQTDGELEKEQRQVRGNEKHLCVFTLAHTHGTVLASYLLSNPLV